MVNGQSALNGKAHESTGFNVFYLYTGYFGAGRSLPAPGYELVQLTGTAGGLNKYTAIGLIFDDAGKTQLQCFFSGALAIEYALHFTGNDNRNGLYHARKIRRCRVSHYCINPCSRITLSSSPVM